MARGVEFSPVAWDEYHEWRKTDEKTFEKVTSLIDECRRTPRTGTGDVEFLRHAKVWSRRIDKKNRLQYRFTDDVILVIRCAGHYDDK